MTDDLERWAADYREVRRPSKAFRERVRRDQLFEDVAQWGAVYRDARTPSERTRARVWEALEAAEASADEDSADVIAMSSKDTSQRWGVGLALGGLVGVAALLLLSVGARALQASTAPEATRVEAQDQAVQDDASQGARMHGAPSQQVIAPADDGSLDEASEPMVEPIVKAPRAVVETPKRRLAPPAASPTPPRKGPSDLESLRRLRAAERMLGRNAKRALSMLDAHAQDFPDSPVALEREALWIRAACASGGHKDLASRKSAFYRRADISAYRGAIERACP